MKTFAFLAAGLCAIVAKADDFTVATIVKSDDDQAWRSEFTVATLEDADLDLLFEEWSMYFHKEYPTEDVVFMRYEVWKMNLHSIASHNSQSGITWWQRLNQFSDLTNDEFKHKMLGYNADNKPKPKPKHFKGLNDYHGRKLVDVPSSIDWTDHNGTSYVTPIKNQGDCGSCWAFSTTGSLECRGAISTGTLNSLSEQQLVDCSDAEGNEGCDGGLMDDAFEYVRKEGGLCSEDEYPYKARDGECKSKTCGTSYNDISGYTDVTHDDSTALEDNVAEGCVSVAVDASDWQSYSRGIFSSVCGTSLDHGVLAVGYGTDSGKDYWKVKNSWGETWGEDGFILLCRNCGDASGECGIQKEPSFPLPSK